MKIKVVDKNYSEVVNIHKPSHRKPPKQSAFFRNLIKVLSDTQLKKADFTYEWINGDTKPDGSCLFLMNHSSFIDLMIATKIIYPNPFHIVCTSDGFVGKEGLMRRVGCIPTKKFITDVSLVKDMVFVTKKLNSSVLMYPEASYSFDGCATPLPKDFGKLFKMLGIPVVMIKTSGAFLRDPLYNCLQVRDVPVSATISVIIRQEDIKSLSVDDISRIVNEQFDFDNFKEQQDKKICVDEPFRADGLHRVLYKCPHCHKEGVMKGEGITVKCSDCNAEYELTECGFLKAKGCKEIFNHIPDWYKWERECVKNEIEDGSYNFEVDVDICMMVDMKAIYRVGEGHLSHTRDGFVLDGCDGLLHYTQHPKASYSLYSDYYWYEIGDVICIGNRDALYYCFPKTENAIVAKARLAAEELYKMQK